MDLRILPKIIIDLMLEQDGGITLVEVKSGQTYQDEWQRGLQGKRAHMGWRLMILWLYLALCISPPPAGSPITPELIAGYAHSTEVGG